MKKLIPFVSILFFLNIAGNCAVDFAVTDISTGNDGFIRIFLQNRTPNSIFYSPDEREKIFLLFYLNNTLRAEYKLKLIPSSFFLRPGKTVIVTHFRASSTLLVRAEINLPPLFAEDKLEDNRLEKKLGHDSN